MKTLPPERRNPQLATAEGSEGENTRDCTSDVGIMIALSFLTHQYRAKISLAYVAGVLRVPDRNSRDDARHGFNLDDKTNPALTAPLVNWPVKPAAAVPTHQTGFDAEKSEGRMST